MNKFEEITPEVYYCRQDMSTALTAEDIDWIREKARASALNKARICLHNTPDDTPQQMLIVQMRGNYIKPHINRHSEKYYQIISGEMLAVIFSDNGEVIRKDRLNCTDNFIYKIQHNNFHTFIPLSEDVIYMETVAGPFTQTEFATWAPAENMTGDCQQYIKDLLAEI